MRTRSTGSTSSSKVRIGLIFSVVPSHAPAAPMRPHAAGSRVSTANQSFRVLRDSSAASAASAALARGP